jgi:alkanesulfonate monooxygenase SsuD/methylene tetrahydromethanopterin reductase-like flavin-dependent oxidoreductase (luciferase family)
MLGTMVTGVTYRNPAILAKTVTTLDIVSKGRAMLGIGAAWNDVEHAGYGVEFPPIGEREDRLEEALTICKAMFTQESPSFEGRHYRIDRALNNPRPIRPGGPRIMVGGGGEKRTLKIAARFADITNWFGSLDEAAAKLAILDRHCEAVGRDPSEILRTVAVPIVPVAREADKAAVLERIPVEQRAMFRPVLVEEGAEILRRYLDAGFGGFTFRNVAIRTPEAVGLVGDVSRRSNTRSLRRPIPSGPLPVPTGIPTTRAATAASYATRHYSSRRRSTILAAVGRASSTCWTSPRSRRTPTRPSA